ncbi:MAG: peptidoglycan DD-metalloendopeptidase family protein [Kofleriaceae bacterium]
MVDKRSLPRKKSARAPLPELGARGPARRGTVRVFFVLGVLVLVNLYVFLWRDGTSIGDVRAKANSVGTSTIDPAPAPPPRPVAAELPADGPRSKSGAVAKGDSLGKILRGTDGANLSAAAADELIRAVGQLFDLRNLRVGQTYKLVVDASGQVVSFELVVSKTVTVKVVRDAAGVLGAEKHEAETTVETVEIGGQIEGSLYASIKAAGEDGGLVSFFVDVFAYDIDFYNDTRAGDTFRVVVEKEFAGGQFLRYRRILAAEYVGKDGPFRAFYWQAGDKPGRYYDETGASVEKSMLKTPLKFARVSSGFNPKRMHPVLHRVKGHFGTDFACPVGTPVWSAADGTITQRGPAGGAGNMVTIRHDNGLVTLYMHLSKFAPGIKVGDRVSAKTVIAYSGNTGLSTGPHLHFGVKQNGSYVDFQSLKPTRAAGVPKAALAKFRAETARLVERLAQVPTPLLHGGDES